MIKPKNVIKKNPDKYIKMIDIFHGDHHDSIVVKADFELDFKPYIKLAKTMARRRILGAYLRAMRGSRKYLAQQIELNKRESVDVVYEKYSTVAVHRYSQENVFSKKSTEMLINGYYDVLGNDLKIGFKLGAITLFLVVALSVYIALNPDFYFRGIF
jgi:hypothetical protein